MCGLAGFSGGHRASIEGVGRRMMASLVHRGPDSAGLWVAADDPLVLAHRRLAIQDLSADGHQPMFSASKRYCVVFNGEIYNFHELRAELRRSGQGFRGHSDTEVLLAGIEQWGLAEAVPRFEGMFAFGLWDEKEKILHLCRDRLGEKPLYYGWLGDGFYFASELKAIEAVVPAERLSLDRQALALYMRYGYIQAPWSIFQGVYKLYPGTILSVPANSDHFRARHSPWPDEGECSPQSYWRVLDVASAGLAEPIRDEAQAVDELDGLLRRTVRRQQVADVGVGSFLSGGIDSSVVTAVMQAVSGSPVRTFTVGYSEKAYDEAPYAEAIARHLGTDHLTVHLGPQDALKVVPDLASIYDEPFADSSQIPAYLVSKVAREHVTVCLSGDGGDELFGGYNRYGWTERVWRRIGRLPGPLRAQLGRLLALPAPGLWDALYEKSAYLTGMRGAGQRLVGLKVQKLAGLMGQRDLAHAYDYLLSYWDKPSAVVAGCRGEASALRGEAALPNSTEFIDQAMYWDQIGYLQGDNLAKVDRASMAVSLETRLPLLSHEIAEFAWRLPLAMRIRGQTTKWALRQVLYRYVPQALIDRPKMGFSVPVGDWLRSDLKEWAEDLLGSEDLRCGELLNPQPILQAWNEHMGRTRDHSHRLWAVLMFLAWAQMNRRYR